MVLSTIISSVVAHMKGWKRISEKLILDHPWLKVYEDKIELDETNTTKWVRFGSYDVNTVVVFDVNQSKFLLNLEYAYSLDDRIHRKDVNEPFDGWIYKFPGGINKEGETPEEAAIREVEEETGYRIEIKKNLGSVRNYFPRSNGIDYKLYAEVVGKGEKKLDKEEEGIQNDWVTRNGIESMIKSKDKRIMHSYFLDTWLIYKSSQDE